MKIIFITYLYSLRVAETEEQKAERLKKWEKHLQEEDLAVKKKSVKVKDGSDEDTRSSAGSADETDEEATDRTGSNKKDSKDRSPNENS